MARRILHYDIDAFFTQCAAAEWPDTAGTAELLVVGGSAESRGWHAHVSAPTSLWTG